PTLCELAGAPLPPAADGRSLCPQLAGGEDDLERMVIAEVGGSMGRGAAGFSYGQMVKCGRFKYIHYDGYDEADALYDVDADPEETTDLRDRHPQLVARMRALLAEKCRPVDQIRAAAEQMRENLGILTRCDFDNTEERWRAPECARHAPEPMVKSRLCQ